MTFSSKRHIDVAILYGLGQKDRAQHVARKMREQNRQMISAFGLDETRFDL